MATRTRKQTVRYRKHLRKNGPEHCEFCLIDAGYSQFIAETKSFKIITNIFPYSHWDLQKVSEHLLIVPKKHTDTLSDLTAPEAIEYVDLLGSYERRGYNVYSRAPQSGIKTVIHQHTHLIKGEGRQQRLLVYLKRPYLRLSV